MKCKVTVGRSFTFEASHILDNLPPEHLCGRLHGHTYTVTIYVSGTIDEKTPWHTDFWDLKDLFDRVHSEVGHRHLNDIEGMHTASAEHIAWWLFRRIKSEFPALEKLRLDEGDLNFVEVFDGGPV